MVNIKYNGLNTTNIRSNKDKLQEGEARWLRAKALRLAQL